MLCILGKQERKEFECFLENNSFHFHDQIFQIRYKKIILSTFIVLKKHYSENHFSFNTTVFFRNTILSLCIFSLFLLFLSFRISEFVVFGNIFYKPCFVRKKTIDLEIFYLISLFSKIHTL